jgi:hypothetical protein
MSPEPFQPPASPSETTPDDLDVLLSSLGLAPDLTRRSVLQRGHASILYRLVCGKRTFVLKRQLGPAPHREPQAYQLLSSLGVPLLPLYGWAQDAVLLEDLASSRSWRLANQVDLGQVAVGAALADWYRQLHTAGDALLEKGPPPAWLMPPEPDLLTPENILAIRRRLESSANPVWELAADNLPDLQAAVHRQPLTLNYNDFHWTNLALSRQSSRGLQAVVFDYHLLGSGMRFSDLRNAGGELGEAARGAFHDHYGPADPVEAVLDAPLSLLYGLQAALERPSLPPWAEPLVAMVASGELEASLRRALALLG